MNDERCKSAHVFTHLCSLTGCNVDDFSGQFFRIIEIIIFCFVVAMCDLVHAVEAIYGLP